jgi:hypothetical protein
MMPEENASRRLQPRNDPPFDLEAIARLTSHERKEVKTITELYDNALAEKLIIQSKKQEALDHLFGILVQEREVTNEMIRLDESRNIIIRQAKTRRT